MKMETVGISEKAEIHSNATQYKIPKEDQ